MGKTVVVVNTELTNVVVSVCLEISWFVAGTASVRNPSEERLPSVFKSVVQNGRLFTLSQFPSEVTLYLVDYKVY